MAYNNISVAKSIKVGFHMAARNSNNRRSRNLNASGPTLRHPSYAQQQARRATNASWEDKERAKSGRDISRRFKYIVILCIAILVIVVLGAITANRISAEQQAASVSAADTYAISSTERSTMEDTSRNFATALIASTYLNDQDVAQQMRDTALGYMATDTDSYKAVQALAVGTGSISQDNLYVDITDLKMTVGSQAYSGIYTYTLKAQAADKSTQTYPDNGYKFTITYQKADGDNGTQWVISNVDISKLN